MQKIFSFGLLTGLLIGLTCGGLFSVYFYVLSLDQKSAVANVRSQVNFHNRAAANACVGIEQYKKVARSYGWQTEDEDAEFVNLPLSLHIQRHKLGGALRVFVKPEVPFSKEAGLVFVFHKDGCIVG